jgi:inosine/xanthosine triphosphatase
MSQILKIAVGSKNPIKLSASLNGTRRAWVDKQIEGVGFDVPSGVSDQPMGNEETKLGAGNRARAAYDAYKDSQPDGAKPDYAVGLEGGVMLSPAGELECFAWIAVYDGEKTGYARTGSFVLPPRIRDLVVKEGMELGHADDLVFGATNSKQSAGAVGFLTRGVVDRAQYYEHAVVLAYIPFQWPDLY